MYEQQDLKLVGSRIKAVRISRGMSQADLAVEASVSLPLISNIERGKTGMQLETFVKVAEALQVSADYLLRPDVPEVKAIYQNMTWMRLTKDDKLLPPSQRSTFPS